MTKEEEEGEDQQVSSQTGVECQNKNIQKEKV